MLTCGFTSHNALVKPPVKGVAVICAFGIFFQSGSKAWQTCMADVKCLRSLSIFRMGIGPLYSVFIRMMVGFYALGV